MRRQRRGLSLIYVLLVVAILFIVTGTMTAIGIGNLNLSLQDSLNKQAYYAANAGAQYALLQLKANPPWTPSPNPTGDPTVYTTLPSNYGRYAIRVVNNYNNNTTVTAPHGVAVPPGFVYVLSYGQDPSGKITRQLGGLFKAGHIFDYGMFGKASITLGGGAVLDSYDSSISNYDHTPIEVAHNPNNLQVGTDGTTSAVVSVDGSKVHVYGSVDAGPGADLNTAFSINGQSVTEAFSGTAGTLFAAINFPPVTVPTLTGPGGEMPTSGVVPPGSYDSLKLTGGGTITLKATNTNNTYYITGDVSLVGNSTIQIDNSNGPVKLYFAGSLDLGGGTIVNPSQVSTDFQIYGTATAQSDETVKITGGANAAYTLYAPNNDVKIVGGADFYGAVVGNTVVNTGGSAFHYDRATRAINQIIIFQPAGWQRY